MSSQSTLYKYFFAPYNPNNHNIAISFSAIKDNPSRKVRTISACAGLSASHHRASVSVSFVYYGDGNRVQQIYSAGASITTTVYLFGGAYEVTLETLAVRKYYSLAGQMIAMRDAQGLKYFPTDHLGSVLAVTDSNGNVISQQRYLPFGQLRTDVGPSVTQTDFAFTSQRNLDAQGNASLGLMDYHARMYDPTLMRWTQPDTITKDQSNLQSLNRFSYVVNNPILLTDPTGNRFSECGQDGSECGGSISIPINPPGSESGNSNNNTKVTTPVKGGLYGPPGGVDTEPDPTLPDEPGKIPEPIDQVVNATGIAINIFAYFTYYIRPNFNPEYSGYGYYEPLPKISWPFPSLSPIKPIPMPSGTWYKATGVGVANNSYETIRVSSIYTSQGGTKFNLKNSTQVLPFTQPTYISQNYNTVEPGKYSNVFGINQNNYIVPGGSFFINISVISASDRVGNLTISITP